MEKIKTYLDSFSNKLHIFSTTVLLPGMAVLITLDVVLRYFFSSPLVWSGEVNGILLFFIVLSSIIYCWDKKGHVKMEIVYVLLKGRLKQFADILAALAGMLFIGLWGIQSIREIPYMIKTNETGVGLKIPLWPFRGVMAVIAVLFFLKLLFFVLSYRKGKD
jgi:TRAP-type C4-dicarboxylate transport system permease small subunit